MTESDSNVIPIRPPKPADPDWGTEFEGIIERERDKLLYVAELLEMDSYCHDTNDQWPRCNHCDQVNQMRRKFRGMAARIRRFWGCAVQPVTDEKIAEMISDKLTILNWKRLGRIPVMSDPMRDIGVARELQRLRAEERRLRAGIQRIADGYGGDVASFARNLLKGKA